MQDQALTPLPFKVGVVKELTPSAADGFWTDADKVRFRFGKPEVIGGWFNVTTSVETADLWGQPRALETVRTNDGILATVIGTHVGVFSSDLSSYYDITPLVTTINSTDILSTTLNSRRIVVSVTAHALSNESIVGIVSAGVTVGGNILICSPTATPTYFQVSVIDANSFAIEVSTSAAATSATTGGNITVNLYLAAGRVSNELVGGWGTGAWDGAFGWGSSPSGLYSLPLRQWSFDHWGTEVLGVPSGGGLYLYSPQVGLNNRMTLVTAAPSIGQIVHVTDARHVVLYGTHDTVGAYDSLLIRWSSQEDYDDWVPSATNTSGDYRLPTHGSEILNVTDVGDKQIILTDTDVFSQNYIGGNDVFGFTKVADNCGVIARYAAVAYSGALYWMGRNGQFYMYNGRVEAVPCPVLRYVFDNLDATLVSKIYAGTNSKFDEIIWFYPSTNSTDGENDRYIIYNTQERHWSIGALRRNVWHDSGTYVNPLAAGPEDWGLFYHEVGYSDNGSPLSAYLESAYFDLKGGDDIMFLSKIAPDFTHTLSGAAYGGSLSITLRGRKYPGGAVVTKGPYLVNAATEKFNPRLRAREMSLRLDSSSLTEAWRLGEFRAAFAPDGKR